VIGQLININNIFVLKLQIKLNKGKVDGLSTDRVGSSGRS